MATAVDIRSFLEQEQQKELLRFTTAGSVDDGKSTLIGRLLYDSKGVYEDQLASVRQASVNRNAGPIDFSLLTDGLRAEREQGITIDVAYRYFTTPKRKFIIADTPGHEQYTRNMATGASTAQAAIVLVDARKGVLPQSRRHAYIAALLGIPSVLVAVNKMDLVDYSREVFESIRDEFRHFVRDLHIHRLAFIPISALEGDNVVKRSDRTPWYDGPSVLEYLETVPIEAEGSDEALRLPVQYVIRPSLDFRGYAGQIASGRLNVGDRITVLPSGRHSRVRSIVTYDGELESAHAPMSVTVTLEDEIDISRGDMLVRSSNVPDATRYVEAQVVWMHSEALEPNRHCLVKHTTQRVAATVSEIVHRIDVNTLAELPAERLQLNEIGKVRLETRKPLFFDPYQENRGTGSLILIDPINNLTIGAAMITGRYASERTRERVSAAERRKRTGHAAFSVWIGDREGLAYLMERELFDRGCMAHVLTNTVGPHLVGLFRDAGLISICTGGDVDHTDLHLDDLAENDLDALRQAMATLESRGLVRRQGIGLDGEGI
jgi:sulfate adenylyltransferase large subunit